MDGGGGIWFIALLWISMDGNRKGLKTDSEISSVEFDVCIISGLEARYGDICRYGEYLNK